MSAQAENQATWLSVQERGATFGIVTVARVATWFGRPLAQAFLAVVVLYYALSAPRARRNLREYYLHLGKPAGFFTLYAHLRRFAECALDRLFFLQGKFSPFELSSEGHHFMAELAEKKRGAILLGAHIGSFEVLRASSISHQIKINVVANYRNTARLNDVLSRLGGSQNTKFIDAGGHPATLALTLKEAIERGELVAILADRAGTENFATVPFLGAQARFPTGPFIIAALLGCPVYFTCGLYFAPRRYKLHCQPFADKVELPRAKREEALQQYVSAYAQTLEHFCRQAPDNWFNFFEFWSPPHARPTA